MTLKSKLWDHRLFGFTYGFIGGGFGCYVGRDNLGAGLIYGLLAFVIMVAAGLLRIADEAKE